MHNVACIFYICSVPQQPLGHFQKTDLTAPHHTYTEQLTEDGILALPLVSRAVDLMPPAGLLRLSCSRPSWSCEVEDQGDQRKAEHQIVSELLRARACVCVVCVCTCVCVCFGADGSAS